VFSLLNKTRKKVTYLTAMEIDQLVGLLIKGERKEIQVFLRNHIEEMKKTKSKDLLVWQGWLAAIDRNEKSSLFFKLSQGMSKKEVNQHIRELSSVPVLLKNEDPIQNKPTLSYLKHWKVLLRAYSKQTQQFQ
jgi:hypothetical protein